MNTLDNLSNQHFNPNGHSNAMSFNHRDPAQIPITHSADAGISSNDQRNHRNRSSYQATKGNNELNAQTSIVVRNQINIINNGTNVNGTSSGGSQVHQLA
jgi:hypothetical protein